MTKFEKDLQKALTGGEIEVITEYRAEIKNLKRELAATKNDLRCLALTQDIERLSKQLAAIEAQF